MTKTVHSMEFMIFSKNSGTAAHGLDITVVRIEKFIEKISEFLCRRFEKQKLNLNEKQTNNVDFFDFIFFNKNLITIFWKLFSRI
jgi:hypothetical protein